MRLRVVPLLLHHYQKTGTVPQRMAVGFAAYILFTKPIKREGDSYTGLYNGHAYPIQDNEANFFMQAWQHASPEAVVGQVLGNAGLWDSDLTLLAGFKEAVTGHLTSILQQGAAAVLKSVIDAEKTSLTGP